MIIAVIGGSEANTAELQLAYDAGFEIAHRGHTLICGGAGGVMREACRGAREGGGKSIGILPGKDRADANEFVDFPIVTGLGFARNTVIARTADALVAIGGKYGTLSEIAFAFICDKPVAGLHTWALSAPDGEATPIHVCETAAAALDYCESTARR